MNWYKKAQSRQDYIKTIDLKYPQANGKSGNLFVRNEIPNTSSISASVGDHYTLRGIRNVPISEFSLTGKSYSVEDNKQIEYLEDKIRESGEINTLIVVIDKDGPYILEGSHRSDALYNIGSQFIPALVIIDLESNELV
jgi:hypothetical protein